MNILTHQIAKHFKEVFFGGNWTFSNLKDTLSDISFQQATTKIEGFNTIAVLLFHIHYFVEVSMRVLEGGPLVGNDKFSFDLPTLHTKEDWEKMVQKVLEDAEKFTSLVEQLPESKLWENFTNEKYGNYYRNIHGIIEHTHYHLGQIVILKKLQASNK